MTICLRCLVSGRVQGVFYRASTREKARAFGVEARATNLSDGCVEVWIRGEADLVERLRQWLWEGPPMARVEHVHCTPADPDDFDNNFDNNDVW